MNHLGGGVAKVTRRQLVIPWSFITLNWPPSFLALDRESGQSPACPAQTHQTTCHYPSFLPPKPLASTHQALRHGSLVPIREVLLQGQNNAVGDDGGQDHVFEGRVWVKDWLGGATEVVKMRTAQCSSQG